MTDWPTQTSEYTINVLRELAGFFERPTRVMNNLRQLANFGVKQFASWADRPASYWGIKFEFISCITQSIQRAGALRGRWAALCTGNCRKV